MPMTAVNTTFTQSKLLPLYEPCDAIELQVNLTPSTVFAKGQLLELATSANDVQTITAPGSGAYTLTITNPLTGLSGTTISTAFGASDATVQTNINTVLAATGGGTATVSSLAVTFSGALAARPVPLMVYAGTAGGSVAHTTTGASTGCYQTYTTGPAKAILPYACATDSAGRITLGAAATGGYIGAETLPSIGAYFTGIFDTSKIVGMDADAVTDLGRLLSGTYASGVLVVTGP